MYRYKTPLRYPGGKQRLSPFISEVLAENGIVDGHYVEPYAGGAGVAIEMLLAGKSSHIHLNDSSYPVYCFWKCILKQTDEFCRRVLRASLTVAEWRRQKAILAQHRMHEPLDVAFSFFFINRCNRSGIPSGGVIGGLKQTGRWRIDARYPRTELVRRIEAIASKKKQISIRNDDAEDYICDYIADLPRQTLVYCDPPYYDRARRLYFDHYQPDDHARLAKTIQRKMTRRWIVSYDNARPILKLYSKRRFFLYDLQYNANRVYTGREVFVFSDKINIPASSSLHALDVAIKRGRFRKAAV